MYMPTDRDPQMAAVGAAVLAVVFLLNKCEQGNEQAQGNTNPVQPETKPTLLKTLNLSHTLVTDARLKEIAKLQILTVLDLSFSSVSDASLKEIAQLQNLTELDLGDTAITDAGIKEILKLQNLTELDLRHTKVTDAGINELRKALPNCAITN